MVEVRKVPVAVIAKFSLFRASGIFLFLCSALAVFLWMTVYDAHGNVIGHISEHGNVWILFVVAGWIASAVLAYWLFLFAVQAPFYGLRAVWVEEGRLIYLSRYFLNISCTEIVHLRCGTYGPYQQTGIFVRTRDGREKVIPASTLSEPCSIILVRLITFVPTENLI